MLEPKKISPQKILENKLARMMSEANLPSFVEQHKAIPNRMFLWDFGFLDYKVLVEVQGGIWMKGKRAHTSGTGVRRDAEKSNLALINGFVTVIITTDMIGKSKGKLAIYFITEVLKKRGWKCPNSSIQA